jgi:hypothetical protein
MRAIWLRSGRNGGNRLAMIPIARKAIENELIRAEATIAALTLSRSIAHEQGDVRRFQACDAALREAREDFRIYSTAKECASC